MSLLSSHTRIAPADISAKKLTYDNPVHSATDQLKCNDCGYIAKDDIDLEEHYEKKHPNG